MINLTQILSNYYSNPLLSNTQVNKEQLADLRLAVVDAQTEAMNKGIKLSPNSNVIKRYKTALPSVLPQHIFSIVLGHMLGDCAVKYDGSKDQASMTFEWGNMEYAQYVYSMLSDYVLSPPRTQSRVNANGNTVITYCFQTVTHTSLAVFHHLFIVSGVKTVPTGLIRDLLTPLALATWYMDDGGLTDYRPNHGLGMQLNTQGFTPEAVAQMVAELNAKYDLECWVRMLNNKGGKPIIVIPSRSYPKFHALVKDYVHTSMAHKLPQPK